MLALPFTILTNSISGKNMGTYLGLSTGPYVCLRSALPLSAV